jgi:uncharacterized protein with HEPN domain
VRSDAERLQDILEAIERIQSRAQIEKLQEDEMLQVWVLYHLQIVGEAVRSLSVELTQQHPEVPWSQIVGTTAKSDGLHHSGSQLSTHYASD